MTFCSYIHWEINVIKESLHLREDKKIGFNKRKCDSFLKSKKKPATA
jgi:hypothetical protein